MAATKPVGPKIAASTSCSRTEVFVGTLARRRWLASAQARTHSTVGPAAVLACPKGTVHAQHLSGQQAPSAQRTCPELRAARSRTRNYTLCTKHICPRATFCPRSRDHSPKTYCARRVYFVLRIVVAWSRGRVLKACCARTVHLSARLRANSEALSNSCAEPIVRGRRRGLMPVGSGWAECGGAGFAESAWIV